MYRRTKRESYFIVLFLLLLGLGIGYAFISTDLTINGIGNFTNSSWDVHFANLVDNTNITLAGTDSEATINNTTRTDITYEVTLVEPGDFYEFTVDVVNQGSLDAMVGVITNNLNGNPIGTGNELPAYARYTATYSDGIAIAPNHLLASNSSESFKVRVEYRTDIDPSVLPSSTTPLTFNFGVSYVQADSNAITRPVPSFANDSWETIISNVKSGTIPSYYTVGSTKEVELGNSLGTHTLRIANTSTPAECSTTGFSQTACGFVLEFADIITTHNMNPSGTYKGTQYNYGWNVDGWPESSMRDYLNNENDSTSVINSLPTVIKNAIINTTVVSGHGSTSGETNFTSTDKLYLLSTHEVWEDVDGNTSDGMDYYDTAYNNTRQLDYYANLEITFGSYNSSTNSFEGNYAGAIKQYNGSNYYWWLRSANSTNINCFFSVINDGEWSSNFFANSTGFGVAPAFRIG